MKKADISVIIINYNTVDILRECLQNLERINEASEVIVVDNASSDGSVAMVKKQFPKVKIIALKENRGLTYPNNLAIRKAKSSFILLLGQDGFPQKGTILGLESYFKKHSEVGAATCKLVLRDGSLDMDAHRGLPTPGVALTHFLRLDKLFKGSRIFDRYFLGYKNLNKPHEIDACITHFMFLRKEVFKSVGGFDEDFFVYGEDVDFCYRIKKRGWKIMYLPQFKAVHYKGVSVGIRKETKDISLASPETKLRMLKMSVDAMEMFYKKHFTKNYPIVLTILIILTIRVLKIVRVLKFYLKL